MTTVSIGATATFNAWFLSGSGPLVLDAPPTFHLEEADGDPVVETNLVVTDHGDGEWRAVFLVDQTVGWYSANWSALVDGEAIGGSEMFDVVEAPGVVIPGACGPDTVYGPCADYVTADDLETCAITGLDLEDDADLLTLARRWASRRVHVATGYRFTGCCESTIRPERRVCQRWLGSSEARALIQGGLVGGCLCWVCSEPGDRIPLPMLPARSVTEVLVDGVVLDPAKYAIWDASWLIRVDGELWPDCQAELPTTEDGTWSVTYRHGLDLPPEAVPLVAQYTIELAKSCKGVECGLGPGIRVVSRDGVEFAVAEPADYREKGLTGFGPLDDWISLLHGGHVAEPPRMLRPGHVAPPPYLVGAP